MTLTEDLQKATEDGKVKQARRDKPDYPKGWEPQVEDFGDGTATAVSDAVEESDVDEVHLIENWNLDPEQWRIVGKVNVRRWQTANGNWLHSYKADLIRKSGAGIPDYDELVQEIKSRKPLKAKKPTGDQAFVVCIADPQLGKDDGYGVEGTIERFLEAIDSVEERVKELRKIGRKLGTLYVFGMGDLIEGCSGHYAQQTFRVELNRRDQVKIMRRLITKALQRWADLFETVVVACVGGNHGENRVGTKSFTDFADNDDVAIFEQISEIFKENPSRYGHVKFVIPDDELSLTLDVCGTLTTITHGHLARGGANAQSKQLNWWKNQAHGQQPAGDSTLLLTGHYHHFTVTQDGAKTHIQCPALEDRGDWWTNSTGLDSPPGVLTLAVGGGAYSDIQVV